MCEVKTSAWLGLGAMGYPMAGNLTAKQKVLVWNRSAEVAERHANSHGTTVLNDDFDGLEEVATPGCPMCLRASHRQLPPIPPGPRPEGASALPLPCRPWQLLVLGGGFGRGAVIVDFCGA